MGAGFIDRVCVWGVWAHRFVWGVRYGDDGLWERGGMCMDERTARMDGSSDVWMDRRREGGLSGSLEEHKRVRPNGEKRKEGVHEKSMRRGRRGGDVRS